MRIKKFSIGPMEANCYLLWDETTKDAAIIDPGYPDTHVTDVIRSEGLSVSKILLTHGHFDHIGGIEMIRHFCPGVSVYVHSADADCLTMANRNLSTMIGRPMAFAPAEHVFADGDTFQIGSSVFRVVHTPGHSSGSVCFIGEDRIFSGDTLFQGSVGRSDFPDGSYDALMRSLDKLMVYPNSTKVYPGHGPDTDIGFEKQMNPFVRDRGIM